MSSFMVSEKSLATIAGHLIALYDFKRIAGRCACLEQESRSAIENACNMLPDERRVKIYGATVNEPNLYMALYSLNARALMQRYNDEYTLPEKAPSGYPVSTPIQLLKTIQCLIYQCCEGNIPNDPLFKMLEEVKSTLMSAIINNMPEYQVADWA